MTSALDRTRKFFKEELGIEIASATPSIGDVKTLALHDITAIIGVGGAVNLLIAFSFSRSLRDKLLAKFTSDLVVPPEQKGLYARETAAEIVNIVMGHCTIDLQSLDGAITLSPPVIIEKAKSIRRPKNAVFANLRIETEFGCADINFVGPRGLFDEYLNYIQQKK